MLPRVLEPELMDTPEEARAYDAMDHQEVNVGFVADVLAVHGPARGGPWLDVGTGTARIPILLCQADPNARVEAIDLAEHMLDLARTNVAEAGLHDRIRCERVDAKTLPYPEGTFEAVVSNSIVHHIPEPAGAIAEMVRVVAPGGTLFVRDLARPVTLTGLEQLVDQYAGSEPPHARAMFRASLHAALSVEEMRSLLALLDLPPDTVSLTSDRHWTLSWRRPG